MIYSALFLVMILVAFDRLHCLRVSTLVFTYQTRLFEIRDHLREGVANGKVSPNYWVFQYLDSTIVKTIDHLDRLTIWRVIGLALAEPGARRAPAIEILQRELSQDKNQYVQRVYRLYQGLLILFLLERHPVLRLAIKGLFGVAFVSLYLQRKFQRAASITASASETSTLAEFVPA